MSDRPAVEALAAAVRAGDRTAVGRALTLVESRLAAHQEEARLLLSLLADSAGAAMRIAVSGPPGAGKSTLIEALGCHLLELGRRVAVLAVDPSSAVTGGSILGDKTRMARLALDPRAFVRPSPSGGTLGGVTSRAREAMRVLEAAGHDVVLVETVGVGQSEGAAAAMVDCFVVVLAPGGGDELQGIKRGILELADLVVINKADGEGAGPAERARRDFSAALRLLHGGAVAAPPVLATSALTGRGVAELWEAIARRCGPSSDSRRGERTRAFGGWAEVDRELGELAREDPAVATLLAGIEERLATGEESPGEAAARILAALRG